MACIGLTFPLTGCQESLESSPTSYDSGRVSDSSDGAASPRAPVFSKTSKKMPAHGKLIWLESKANTAILKRNIRNGGFGRLVVSVPSGRETYYVKLKEVSRDVDVLGAVIAPGRTLTIKVPLDGNGRTTYELHYGAGTSWYGRAVAFGPAGAYAEADETFSFKAGTGWEVELILQPGGNLGTSGLDYDSF